MKFSAFTASCLAIVVAMSVAPADAQGPVRRGLRRTGEAVVNGTGAVVQGAGRVVQGTGQAAAGVARGAANATGAVVGGAANATGAVIGGAANATRAVVGGTARGIAAGVDAITPGVPFEARGGAFAGDRGPNARWRFQQHNGEWWYYNPQNQWMYHRDGNWNNFAADSFQANPQFAGQAGMTADQSAQIAGGQQFSGQYSSGFRGDQTGQPIDAQGAQQGGQYQGPAYPLQHDENGREFICDHGQRVYFDNGQQGGMNQQDMGAQGMGRPSPTPAVPTEGGASGPQSELQGRGVGGERGESGQPETGSVPEAPRDELQQQDNTAADNAR